MDKNYSHFHMGHYQAHEIFCDLFKTMVTYFTLFSVFHDYEIRFLALKIVFHYG